MQKVVVISSLKIVALTSRAHFYVNPGKSITNRYNWFSLLTNLKEKVKIDLLENLNILILKSPVTGLIDYWYN